jgi:capsular exopolysaccharide synthesis family protein
LTELPTPSGASDESLLEQYPLESRPWSPREEPSVAFERPAVDFPPARQGAVWHFAPKAPTPPTVRFDHKLVVSPNADPLLVEEHRRLAASMQELQIERGLKMLTVTSAMPREGKTLTVTNLALTLSESYGRRVLLIDADLRRPSIHELFGVPNTAGLSDALTSDRPAVALLSMAPTLSVLFAGQSSPNPVAAISSDRMRALLAQAVADFDWVLLDSPPVNLMPDAGLLGGLTRAVLLVIGAGITPYEAVGRAIEELGRDCIVGTVLNRVDTSNRPEKAFYSAYQVTSIR